LWSPESVIKEIDFLVERRGVKNIKFVDEMFVLNRNHVLGICDRIIERGHKLNIWAYARVDTVKDEFLDKLARAGFRWLALGIESGSKHVRDGMEKGRFGSTDILKVVKKIQDAGINVSAATSSGSRTAASPCGDARPRAGGKLRVCQLLLRDGLSRLQALLHGRGKKVATAGLLDRLLAAQLRDVPAAH
jgi:hypothetical protein